MPKPKPVEVLPTEQYTTKTVKNIIETVKTTKDVKPFEVKDIVKIEKTDQTMRSTYEITVQKPEGVEVIKTTISNTDNTV